MLGRCKAPATAVAGELQPWEDVHGHQLLEQQLARVRNAQGCDGTRRAAVVAPVRVGQEAARSADVHFAGIAGQHQSL